MAKKLTTEEFIERAQKVHGDKYDYSHVEYKAMKQKVVITCPHHGDFAQSPDKHLQGQGCPECGRLKTRIKNDSCSTSKDYFIFKAREAHGDKYDYSQVEYSHNNCNVEIICPVHGSFWQLPRMHTSGKGCPVCAEERRLKAITGTLNDFIDKARSIHGTKYDYSKTQYKNIRTKCCIICPVHGEFYQTPHEHLLSHGCPQCGRQCQADAMSKTQEHFVKDAISVHGKQYGYEKAVYVNNTTKVCITCPEHGDFWQTPNKHLGGSGCPECGTQRSFKSAIENGTIGKSQTEETLYKMLIKQFGEKDVCRQYDNDSRYPFPCDFYIVSQDLFIELNVFWTHGGHWFDENNSADKEVLAVMASKKSSFYKNAIRTWTVRDPLKRKTAEENHLNYLVFWDKNLADAKEWLKRISMIEEKEKK